MTTTSLVTQRHWREVSRSKVKHNRSGDVELLPANPPAWSVANLAERGSWTGIRRLEAVVEAPTLRPDGTVLDTPGYDAAIGLLYEPRTHFPSVPTHPSKDDAFAAADALLELVAQFPFADSGHMAAWLSALLTPLARFAFPRPAPLFLFDANTPGTGKTLLASIISEIAEGRELSRTPYPADNAEMKKVITAIALNGDKLILLDNIDSAIAFACASLDAALTGTSWEDRILGASEMTRLPLYTVWCASGNNVAVRGDVHRRLIPIKLEYLAEKPEERTGFKYPNLLGHIRAKRASLVVAALTILRGFFAAGCPSSTLPPFGSYEGWSRVVRGAVHWATGRDPAATRAVLPADESRSSLGAVLDGWAELPNGHSGETVAEGLRLVKAEPETYRKLSDAFMGWAKDDKLPGPRVVGNRLRALKNRVINCQRLHNCSVSLSPSVFCEV